MAKGSYGGRDARSTRRGPEGLGKSEGDFKTPVPKALACATGLVRVHPFDIVSCAGCVLAKPCANAASDLPLLVIEPVPGLPERPCRRGDAMVVCQVRRAPELAGEKAEAGDSAARHSPKLYLLDANVLLNAFNGHPEWGEDCWWVMKEAGIRIATTEQVVAEAYDRRGHDFPSRLEIVEVAKIDKWILELRPPEGVKELSGADRSLIQAVCDLPDARGIITYDPDFHHVAVGGILTARAGRKIDVLNASQLRAKMNK